MARSLGSAAHERSHRIAGRTGLTRRPPKEGGNTLLRVCMLVTGTVSADSRFIKEASSLVAWGAEVSVLDCLGGCA